MVFTVRFILGIILLIACTPLNTAVSWRYIREVQPKESQNELNKNVSDVAELKSPDINEGRTSIILNTQVIEPNIPKTDENISEDNKNNKLDLSSEKPINRESKKFVSTENPLLSSSVETVASSDNIERHLEADSDIFDRHGQYYDTEDSSEKQTTSRNENGRSLDFDVNKYVSPEFHNKNNVFNLPTSPENKKYVTEFAEYKHTSKPASAAEYMDYSSELTTPKSEIFDTKFFEVKDRLQQNLQSVDDEFKSIEESFSSTPDKELIVSDLIRNTKENGTNGNLEYLEYKHINLDNSNQSNAKHKDIISHNGLHLNFTYNDTKFVDEHTVIPIIISSDEINESQESKTVTTVVKYSTETPLEEQIEQIEKYNAKINNESIYAKSDKHYITKPPKVNDTQNPLLSNKIELEPARVTEETKGKLIDSAHVLVTTLRSEIDEKNKHISEENITIDKRGTVKHLTSIALPDDVSSEIIDTAFLNKTASNETQINEQTVQENQIIPVTVLPQTTASPIEKSNLKTTVSTVSVNDVTMAVKESGNKGETTTDSDEKHNYTSELTTGRDDSITESVTNTVSETTIYVTSESGTTDGINDISTTDFIPESTISTTESAPGITTDSTNEATFTLESTTLNINDSSFTMETETEHFTYTNYTTDANDFTTDSPTTTAKTISSFSHTITGNASENGLLDRYSKYYSTKTITERWDDLQSNQSTTKQMETSTELVNKDNTIVTNEVLSKSENTLSSTINVSGTEKTYILTTLPSTKQEYSTNSVESSTSKQSSATDTIDKVTRKEDVPYVAPSVYNTTAPINLPTTIYPSTTFTIDARSQSDMEQNISMMHDKPTNRNHASNLSTRVPVKSSTIAGENFSQKLFPRIVESSTQSFSREELDETSTLLDIEDNEGDDEGNGTVIAIVISCVGAVCLVLLVGLLIVMRKRQKRFNYPQMCKPVDLDSYNMDNVSVYNSVRRKAAMRASKRSYGNPAFDDPTSLSRPLNFQALAKFTNQDDIKAEFDEIPQVTARTNELPDGCEVKNRYANVIPLPETRVFLKEIEGTPNSDYINANYVTGPKSTKGYYIACQAPMSNTVDDFWRMVWEQQSKVIIMLTHLYENGVEKCFDYLPPSEVDCHRLFGDYQITLKKRDVKEKYIISSLQLKNMVSNSWREITHLWYLGWPEKGVPTEANSLIAFLIEARSFMKSSTNGTNTGSDTANGNLNNGSGKSKVSPVVVHCSPGTGRTGTVLACDIAIREFELTRQVDVPRIIYKIRRDRASSVQTREQYSFIYKVITLYATKLTGGALDSL